MRITGLTAVAWSAASSPAPPAPMIRMSHSRSSSGSNVRPRWHEMWIADERVDAPVCDDQSDDDETRSDDTSVGGADAAVIEDDVAEAVQTVIKRDQQEGD